MQHELRWHKKSRDGSGKCDIFFTGDPGHQVHGVLFEISESEKARLDKAEGLHDGYEDKMVEVITLAGIVYAVTYYATVIGGEVRPYEWYKRYVVDGANEHSLPKDYVQWLNSVDAITDPDQDRHQKEIRILEGR